MAAREAASEPGNGPWANLVGGLWNIASAPVQLPVTIAETSIERNVLYGLTAGTLQGAAKTLMSLVGGFARVATAIIPADPMELVARKLAYAQGR